ncbi:hypothetical protein BOW53_04310 [Solemya pervernicosa gill symbiont]|uniref:Peptidyl-prolyl cis-trans isomerase n=2 Tax=Gammaproteobacteria incertae sedis TaxID=118884 RepID=A0A1T2L8C8_9GAMM|nr:FKBP-type peptidyl-prolyl cis-trans isomerase [Candidatus Reidiella endopervernicosa]OOZ41345.1 hypothetical protein BOW53_04310 [Solemya pervernicosa gill symbiont]QKQ27723.1 FKBP-type peptidyl-prolyl cis-trans isomerase [Candidatus Reidiella endopervernicosa]
MSENSPVVTPESRVTLNFTMSLTDGTLVDATDEGEPHVFTMGDGSMIDGLELAITGLHEGERAKIAISPQQGFGFPDPERIHQMERDKFKDEMELEPGLIIAFSTPAGEEVPGTILEVGDEMVKIDFNHPLAGRDFIFEVEIIEVV